MLWKSVKLHGLPTERGSYVIARLSEKETQWLEAGGYIPDNDDCDVVSYDCHGFYSTICGEEYPETGVTHYLRLPTRCM